MQMYRNKVLVEMSLELANTTTVTERHANQVWSSLSIQCVPSMYITKVFIGGDPPPKCNYYPMPLQRLYSQNIPGRTRNFLITIMSGLQLR